MRERKEKRKKEKNSLLFFLSPLSLPLRSSSSPLFLFPPPLPTSFSKKTMASIRMAAPCGVASRSGGVSPKVRSSRERERYYGREQKRPVLLSLALRRENTYNFFPHSRARSGAFRDCLNPPTPRRGEPSMSRVSCEADNGILSPGKDPKRGSFLLGF